MICYLPKSDELKDNSCLQMKKNELSKRLISTLVLQKAKALIIKSRLQKVCINYANVVGVFFFAPVVLNQWKSFHS